MYPNESCKWVPVALSADIPAGTVAPGWVPGGELALWRSASGKIAASTNRCPHRGMRLSHGFVRGEVLSCIYHGWSYGSDGACVRIPAHPDLTPPEVINTRNKVVEEVNGIVWVCDEHPNAPPPEFPDVEPLRSLTVDAGVAALEDAIDAKESAGGLLRATVAGVQLHVIAVPQESGQTLVHILVNADGGLDDRIAASRAAEILRRQAEAVTLEGNAA